ncbi:hypothetical protein OAM96_01250 [Candidatus Poseidoniaceae archaeon]|mgnify:FL=1|jgi:hypothetical protein|nr:hypothetical protein [Candidatus Poseidoniaceae archaeon]
MKTDRVFVLLLVVLLPLSGCFDGSVGDADATDADDDNDGENLWYVYGTTNHTCVPQDPNNSSNNHCISDDETLEDEWVLIQNYTIIHQDINTGINVHSYSTTWINGGGGIGTVCSNGAITGWGIYPDNGDYYDNAGTRTSVEGLLPFAGLECDHYLFGKVWTQDTVVVPWHVTYEVYSLTEGPHN